MSSDFSLVMLSAMYENGGNSMQRLFDGHPQLYVYPFESQLGTKLVNDELSSLFPKKYRWPVFALSGSAEEDYLAIIDEECKVRAKTPQVSKFREADFQFSEADRIISYRKYVAGSNRSRAQNVASFFRATFDAWKNYRATGREIGYLGYSPVVVLDAEKIITDFPRAFVLHVIRNPWSAYADTKKRALPMSLESYLSCWVIVQYFAKLFSEKYPKQVYLVRYEELIENPSKALGVVCDKWGLETATCLAQPSWNGTPLNEVYPWGTIRIPTPAANLATAHELSSQEIEEIHLRARPYLEMFDYQNFIDQ